MEDSPIKTPTVSPLYPIRAMRLVEFPLLILLLDRLLAGFLRRLLDFVDDFLLDFRGRVDRFFLRCFPSTNSAIGLNFGLKIVSISAYFESSVSL